jgi:hypothetical protein
MQPSISIRRPNMRISNPYLGLLLAATIVGCGGGGSGSTVAVSTAVKSGPSKLSSVPTGSSSHDDD